MTFVRYHVRHETLYHYDQVVGESHHLLRLTPRALPWQRNLEHHLAISPDPSARRSFLDCFGNRITKIHFTGDHDYLEIISERLRQLGGFGGGELEAHYRRLHDSVTALLAEWR